MGSTDFPGLTAAQIEALIGSSDISLDVLTHESALVWDSDKVPFYDASAALNRAAYPRDLLRAMECRNVLLNGGMESWLRGTSFDSTVGGAGMCADGWRYDDNGSGAITVARDTDVPDVDDDTHRGKYSMLISVATADTSLTTGEFYVLEQWVPAPIGRLLVGRKAALSFWVKFSKTGTYCVNIYKAPAPQAHYTAEFTVNAADTWEYKTVIIDTFPTAYDPWVGSTLTSAAFVLVFVLAAASSSLEATPNSWQSGGLLSRHTSNQVNGMDSTSNTFRFYGINLVEGEIPIPYQPPAKMYQDHLVLTTTGTINNLDTSGANVIFMNNASDATITGMMVLNESVDRVHRITIVSKGAGNVFLAHENSGSTADNRLTNVVTSIATPLAAGKGSATYEYDFVAQRWRLIAHEQGNVISFTISWTSTGTQPSIGDGALAGTYLIRGRHALVTYSLTFGSTTNPGTGQWIFSVPISPAGAALWGGSALHTGTIYLVTGLFISSSTVQFFSQATAAFQPTVPFTWGSGDGLSVVGEYLIA